MVNAGQLKGARTRAKKVIKDVAEKVNPNLAEMEQNISRASIEEIDQWEPFLGTNIPKLQGKLEILDQATERLETFCQDTNNEAELQILNAELNAGDDMEEFRDMVYRLRDLRERFRDRRLDLKPKVEANVPVAQAGRTDADLIKLMNAAVTTAVTTAMAQLQPQQVQPPAVNVQAAGAARHGVQAQVPLRVKLPKLELSKFSGDIMEWSGFWAQFSKAIHDVPNFPDIEKFQYLKAHLEGEALKAISGYKFTEANYPVVIALLEDRFGTTQPIVEAYYSALNNMPSTGGGAANLRIFYDELERNLRSLEALDQDINSLSILTTIRSKLPHDVRRRLENHKPEADVWTVERLRLYLKRELKITESLSQSDKIFNGSNNNQESLYPKHGGTRPKSNNSSQNEHYKPSPLKPSGSSLVAVEPKPQRNRSCIYCQGSHYADECTQFSTVEDRQNKLREENRCFSCFSPTHRSPSCPKKHRCFHCSAVGKHHRSLCIKKFGTKMQQKPGGSKKQVKGGSSFLSQSDKTDGNDDDSGDETQSSNVIEQAGISVPPNADSQSLLASDESVIMQTAVLKVKNPVSGSFEDTITMFDCGATHTYITNDFAKEMNLPLGKKFSIPISTFGTEKVKSLTVYTSKLVIKLFDGSFMKLNVRVVPTLSGPTHRIPYGKLIPKFLYEQFPLADSVPMRREIRNYQLLIGQDYYFDFMYEKRIDLSPGLYLQCSKVGCIIAGRIKDNGSNHNPSPHMFVHSYLNNVELESSFLAVPDSSLPVSPDMKLFWDLETLGIEAPSTSSDAEAAVQQFNDTVQLKDGRYEVSFPWKVEEPNLPSNYTLAYNRFRSVAKRLAESPDLLKKYDDIIQNQVELGIIEPVNSNTTEGPLKHYVPHHPVEKDTSTYTKVRVVYDASAKTKKDNLSLNECLYPGPSLVKPLVGLLLRFRLYRIGIIADIEKAFLNVGLCNDDRDVTRFFWFKDPTNPTLSSNIQIYRFCRIPFGVTSSPFLLASAVNHLLDSFGTRISRQLRDNIYVDNVITGADDVTAAMQIYNESQLMFNSASLNLREWSSNSEEFLKQLPEHHRADGCIFKVLGILWNSEKDFLKITGFDNAKFEFVTTKREVLQAIASVYDPLGFFTPVVLIAKLFLHSLWVENFDWDHKLPPERLAQWTEIYARLQVISSYKIPRFLGHPMQSGAVHQLLCFCDASADSYATTIYLRSSFNNVHHIDLIFSKTRLSPPNFSIPRLELMAAVIGVRGMDTVELDIRLPIGAKLLWSDSQCVLHWIRNKHKRLSVFCENSVNEIRKTTDITYRYVHTTSNPADMATRGRSVEELHNSIWWHGPRWLQVDEDSWPTWDVEKFDQTTMDSIDAEYRKNQVMHEFSFVAGEGPTDKGSTRKRKKEEISTPCDIDYNDYSSVNKLYRVTAYCLRFIIKCMKSLKIVTSPTCRSVRSMEYENIVLSNSLELSSQEIAKSKLLWELAIQKCYFSDELEAIKTGSKNSLRDQLNLFVDDLGLLRAHGHFENSTLSEATRQPKLLPSKDHLTRLIIESVHRTFLHSGVSQTLASVRQEYWIPQGRSRIRLVLSDCHICRRWMGGPYRLPVMAPWPKERMTQSPAFTVTGLDYFGPLYIKDSPTTTKKVWVCLFTCIAIRAVHLELVEDMSSEHFLMCFQRFIACHGKPAQLISDNATQFKLAKSTIDRAWENALSDSSVVSYIANQGIRWKFIIQFAPWTGGFYERMVGVVKSSLRKAIGKVCLTRTQLSTLLAEIQAVVNSRPLVYVNEDVNSDMALTPSHFLSLNPRNGVPSVLPNLDENDPEFDPLPVSSAQSLLLTWKKGQRHLDRFWKLWKNDYLLSLRERNQHRVAQGRIQSPSAPNPGDVVLIKDDLPRGSWKLGKIHSLIPSFDGAICAAVVKFPNRKTLNRPINLLYPIECPIVSGTAQPILDGTPDTVAEVVPTTDNTKQLNDVVTQRPRRAAAMKARDGIRQCVKSDMVGLSHALSLHSTFLAEDQRR